MTTTVHGEYPVPGGGHASGWICIDVDTVGQVIRDTTGKVVWQGPWRLKLIAGEVTTELPPSDVETLSPQGFSFTITEQLDHVAEADWRVVSFMPLDGETVELADLVSADEAALIPSYSQVTAAAVLALQGDINVLDGEVDDLESAATAHYGNHANPHQVTKTQVGLGSVDDTADSAKPVSTAQQAALDSKADLVGGKVPSSQIPAIALGTTVPVANQAAMLALTSAQVQPGDLAVRADGAGTFMLMDPDPSILGHWQLLNAPADLVSSINGHAGAVVLGAADVGAATPSDVSGEATTARAAELALRNITDSTFATALAAVTDALIDQSVVVVDNGTVSPNVVLGGIRNGAAIASDVTGAVLLNPGGTGYNNVIGGDGSHVGTTTPNTSTTGTGANQSVIAGYDNVAGQLSSKIFADHSKTELGGGTGQGHSGIFGGTSHVIREAAHHSVVLGGTGTDMGAPNSLGSGGGNVIDGAGTHAVIGANNTVHGQGALVTGASNVHASTAIYGRIHGQVCQVDGNFSSADGLYAYARNDGQHAVASARIAALGDAQFSDTHFAIQTTNAVETAMMPGQVGSVLNWAMVRGQTILAECTIVARTVGGVTQGVWKITQAFKWDSSGSSAAIGAATKEVIYAADTGLAVRLDGASSSGLIKPMVTGLAATTINWSARFETTEVVA